MTPLSAVGRRALQSADAEEPNDPGHWRRPSPSAEGSGRGGRPSRPQGLRQNRCRSWREDANELQKNDDYRQYQENPNAKAVHGHRAALPEGDLPNLPAFAGRP